MDKFSTNQKRVIYITLFLIALINLVAILHISSRSASQNPNVNGINTFNKDAIRLNPEVPEDISTDPMELIRPVSYSPISVRAE
jgi:hypothetical protein